MGGFKLYGEIVEQSIGVAVSVFQALLVKAFDTYMNYNFRILKMIVFLFLFVPSFVSWLLLFSFWISAAG